MEPMQKLGLRFQIFKINLTEKWHAVNTISDYLDSFKLKFWILKTNLLIKERTPKVHELVLFANWFYNYRNIKF